MLLLLIFMSPSHLPPFPHFAGQGPCVQGMDWDLTSDNQHPLSLHIQALRGLQPSSCPKGDRAKGGHIHVPPVHQLAYGSSGLAPGMLRDGLMLGTLLHSITSSRHTGGDLLPLSVP